MSEANLITPEKPPTRYAHDLSDIKGVVKATRFVQVQFVRSCQYNRTLYNRTEIAVFTWDQALDLTKDRPYNAETKQGGPFANWVGEVIDGQVIRGPRPEEK